MTEINCSVCEKPIEGFVVYDGEMNAMHPGCAPSEFTAQAKAERKAAKKDHVGVRQQRKIDSLWNRRARLAKRADNLAVESKKLAAAIGEINADLMIKDLQFAEKLAAMEESKTDGEVLA